MNYKTQYIRYTSAICNKMNARQHFFWLQEHVENWTSNLVDTYPNRIWFCMEHIFSVNVLYMGFVNNSSGKPFLKQTSKPNNLAIYFEYGTMCGRVYFVYGCCVKHFFLAPFLSVAYLSLNNTCTSSVSQPSKGSRPRGSFSQWMLAVSVGPSGQLIGFGSFRVGHSV